MKHMRKLVSMLLASCMVVGFAGCDTQGADVGNAGDAMEGQKPVLLAVSFGTSYNDNRDLSIGAIETALAEAYDDYEVRRAFTAQIVIDILEDCDGHEIDKVKEAMDRLVADGVKEVVVQPTHVMNGFEYDDIVK